MGLRLTRKRKYRELAGRGRRRDHGPSPEALRMRKTLQFYLNLALVSFVAARAYGALRRRLARDVARRRANELRS